MKTEPTKKTIWSYKQNRPTLVVRDLARLVPGHLVYSVLLQRGVFKWFAVRRDLIKLKNLWRDRITALNAELRAAKESGHGYEAALLKGKLKAYEECRGEVRALCHSERWRAPDNDREAQRWLNERAA